MSCLLELIQYTSSQYFEYILGLAILQGLRLQEWSAFMWKRWQWMFTMLPLCYLRSLIIAIGWWQRTWLHSQPLGTCSSFTILMMFCWAPFLLQVWSTFLAVSGSLWWDTDEPWMRPKSRDLGFLSRFWELFGWMRQRQYQKLLLIRYRCILTLPQGNGYILL